MTLIPSRGKLIITISFCFLSSHRASVVCTFARCKPNENYMFQLRNHWFHFYDVETEILWGEIPEHDTALKRRANKNPSPQKWTPFPISFPHPLAVSPSH